MEVVVTASTRWEWNEDWDGDWDCLPTPAAHLWCEDVGLGEWKMDVVSLPGAVVASSVIESDRPPLRECEDLYLEWLASVTPDGGRQ